MTADLNAHTWEKMAGASEHIGLIFTYWVEGEARLELPIGPQHLNRHGIPHGGIYAMLLDTAMGYSGAFTGDPEVRQNNLTLTLTVNYLSRPKGKTLIAEGKRVGGGAKTFFAEGKITDETGELIATASGAFKMRSR
ncbi:PaaI family thioesterase [Celeribacter litoreus]|uniref:PaaI family thioesterase n=1 Tax=Celeribacter litoreus TaxID=2876714 RepID=UPI001CC92F6B|nr:PaaI family thioesterase [Celeribacter litoreus]MCA0042878.1 PaaI family thioesterase [Celeribacter litoreus]